MPETTALIKRSNEKIITQLLSPRSLSRRECAGSVSCWLQQNPSPPRGERLFELRQFVALGRGAHPVRNGEWLIGAVEEFDGHEDHLLVAEIFQVVDLILAGAVGFVAGLAGPVGVFDGGAVVDMLAAASAA